MAHYRGVHWLYGWGWCAGWGSSAISTIAPAAASSNARRQLFVGRYVMGAASGMRRRNATVMETGVDCGAMWTAVRLEPRQLRVSAAAVDYAIPG